MKAFMIKKPFEAGTVEVERPVISENEVLIKVAAAGFCGTDIHTYKGEHVTNYPIIPGHEFSGYIEEIGADVEGFRKGDFVLADPNIFCETCEACKKNNQIHCHNIQVIGNTRNGAFAEYVTVPKQCVFHAEGLDPIQAAMAEPLACVINAHNKVSIEIGSNVLVVGAGTIGLMHLLLSKRRGAAKVVVADLKEEALKLAKEIGADDTILSGKDAVSTLKKTYSGGFDVIIDATGSPRAIESMIPLLADNGTFLFFGACPTISEIKVNPFDIYYHDWEFVGSYALQKTMPQSVAMLRSGLDLSALVGEVISIDEMPEVFQRFVDGKTSNKTIVKFN